MTLILSWFIAAIAFWVAAKLIPGVYLRSFAASFWVTILFACMNFLFGWLFWTVFTIGTLGLALLLAFITRVIVNALILKITAAISSDFDIEGFTPAILAAVVISACTSLLDWGLQNTHLLH